MRLFALTKMKKEPSEIFREFEERDEIVSGGVKVASRGSNWNTNHCTRAS